MKINSNDNSQPSIVKGIKYLRLHFVAEAMDDCMLAPYLGSTLRGALGHAFRNNSCMSRKSNCNKCMFIKHCAYAYIFETMRESIADSKHAIHAHVPHPFIIEPPEQGTRALTSGDKIQFSVVLVGRAREYYPFFIMAFEQALWRGLGQNRNRFKLLEVKQRISDCLTIWRGGNEIVNSPVEEIASFLEPIEPIDKITINTITPLRIVAKGRLTDELPFKVLIKSVFRRLDLLDKVHGSGYGLGIPFGEFIRKTDDIEYLCQESTTRWHDWTRFSNRQNTSMQLGGVHGELSYAGDLTAFIPFLRMAEVLHVGKNTSFGLGQYRLIVRKGI